MMNAKNPSSVGVIVVAYEGMAYIDECLTSIESQEYRGTWFMIVVDNHSSDSIVEFVARAFPHAHLITNERNLGFAGGSNIGITYALELGCDAVVLLNQDTVVPPDFLTRLVEGAWSDERIGAAQALVLLHPETHLINSAGNSLHYLGFGYASGYRRPLHDYLRENRDAVIDVAYASGAALLLKRAALLDVGIFDESFFMYHEDLDLGWRMHLRKWRVVVVPAARVYHKYSFEKSIAKYYYMERNRLTVIFKNYAVRTLFLLTPMLLLTEIGLVFSSLKGGYFRQRVRALISFCNPSSLEKLLKSRKIVQQNRTMSDREFSQWLTHAVLFQDIESPLTKYLANPLWKFYWVCVRRFL